MRKILSLILCLSISPSWGAGSKVFEGDTLATNIGFGDNALNTTNVSVCAWFNVTELSADDRCVVSLGNVNTQYFNLMLESTDSSYRYDEDGGTDITGNTSISLNTWTHVCLVKTGDAGTNIQLYYNGSPDGSGAVGTVLATGDSHIGSRSEGAYADGFTGSIYRVTVYERALNQAEVLQDMTCDNQPGNAARRWILTYDGDSTLDLSDRGINGSCPGSVGTNCPSNSEDGPPTSWCQE